MNEAERKRLAKIPRYLIPGRGKADAPGMIKRHVARLCAPITHEWRLFAEACLRNAFFRRKALEAHDICRGCDRTLNDRARIELHHNDYLWSCSYGKTLSEGSKDIARPPQADDYPVVPDCRSCFHKAPEQFAACQARIWPVHAACHERIHDKERYFRKKARDGLLKAFEDQSVVL